MGKNGSKEKQTKRLYPVKKCPECFTILGIHATECFNCGQKVEEPDERGIAKKPIDYKAYSIAILSMVAFVVYLWIMGWSDMLSRAWGLFWNLIVEIVVGIWNWIMDWILLVWEWITKG